jgi:hypothetical protein
VPVVVDPLPVDPLPVDPVPVVVPLPVDEPVPLVEPVPVEEPVLVEPVPAPVEPVPVEPVAVVVPRGSVALSSPEQLANTAKPTATIPTAKRLTTLSTIGSNPSIQSGRDGTLGSPPKSAISCALAGKMSPYLRAPVASLRIFAGGGRFVHCRKKVVTAALAWNRFLGPVPCRCTVGG